MSGDEIIKIKIIFILGLLYCIFVQNLAFAQPLQYVDKITINIKFSDDLKVPIEIEKRITASTLTIANNVLQGQPLDKINEQKKSYETLFQDVLGRILIGYYVQAVRLDVAEQTVVEVELRPWQDSIQSVEVSLVNNDISEPYQDLINEDLRGIKPVIENLLLGLPIDAVYWASSILKTSLNDYFNNKLPEYNYSLDITEGSHTMVRLSLYPKGLLVKNSVVAIRSQTIPNLAFLKLRAKVEAYLEKLNGLPVEFLKRHKDFFTKEIITLIENDDFLKKIALNKTVVIIPGIKNQSDLGRLSTYSIMAWALFLESSTASTTVFAPVTTSPEAKTALLVVRPTSSVITRPVLPISNPLRLPRGAWPVAITTESAGKQVSVPSICSNRTLPSASVTLWVLRQSTPTSLMAIGAIKNLKSTPSMRA